MKLFSISDLHLSLCGEKPMEVFEGWDDYLNSIKQSWLEQVTDDDIVVIAGDISWAMRLDEFVVDSAYFADLPGTKILIRGNHDYWWSSVSRVREVLPPKCYAIQNDCVRVGDFLFCGTRGWNVPDKGQPLSEEDQRILDRELVRMDLTLDAMNKMRKDGDTVVFVTHYPPFDAVRSYTTITEKLEKAGVDIVIYGHLHGKKVRCLKHEVRNGIEYFLTSTDQVGHKVVFVR